jgi:exonuclease SbcD
LPYLRPQDLSSGFGEAGDPLIAGVRGIHDQVFEEMRRRHRPGQVLLATGHCYMVGGRLSELSERKVLGGNLHALPIDIFPADLDYVALGHLHLEQRVAEKDTIRYCGSPLPLSLAEGHYSHRVLQIDLEAGAPPVVTGIPVPRAVEILRLPVDGPRPMTEVLEVLTALDSPLDTPHHEQPYLEVQVLLDRPEPAIRHRIAEALDGTGVRLLRVSPTYPGHRSPLSEAIPEADLGELEPMQVFERRYEAVHGSDPPEELVEAFHELLETVQREEV